MNIASKLRSRVQVYMCIICLCMHTLLLHVFRVSERPTSEEKSGVDLLGFLKGYGFIHDKLMEPHINRCNDDPVSILVHVHVHVHCIHVLGLVEKCISKPH